MSLGRFDQALDFTLRWEGGYVNDPDDPGGATNKGITQATYTAWRSAKGMPSRPVRDITDDEVQVIYRERYWTPVAGSLPAPLDVVAFDTAVNCGVARCLEWLAQVYAVGGEPGAATTALLHRRMQHYDRLIVRRPAMRKFWRGWMRRVSDLAAAVKVDL
jgi:lysozyme family protein